MTDEDMREDEPADRARRLLLKSAVYAAPVVLSFIQVNRAAAQASPCGPGGGSSCMPDGAPCGPDGCMPRT